MFTDKKKTNQPKGRNVISKSTSIVGNIKSEGDFRIEGTVEGTIITKGRVIIGVSGVVKGNIQCVNADIEGSFSGKLIATELLSLKGTAKISGEVFIDRLSVEPGVTFNAICEMKSGVKELNQNGIKKVEKTA